MFEVVSGIPKPEGLPAKRGGTSIYPFDKMKVGDSFVVPYTEKRDDETSEKFRQRVYKSAREYSRRNKHEGEERMEFTAAVMTSDDKSPEKRYVEGDVVVWRDA